MKKYFVTYEIALALKELGFDEISRFGSETSLYNSKGEHIFYSNYGFMYSGLSDGYISAPLWQQVIEWFRNIHNIHISIPNYYDGWRIDIRGFKQNIDVEYHSKPGMCLEDYYEAREQAILKAIEIIKNKLLN